ncbi:MAG: ABC transporter permease [Candidatus Limnocylindrales bacterium]
MRALRALTIANMRSYLRDRQALFWSLAFPLIFVFLFGSIFGGGSDSQSVAWVDEDASQASAGLRAAFASVPGVKLVDLDRTAALEKMKTGDNAGVIVIPKGYGDVVAAAATDPSRQTDVTYFVDPSQQTASAFMASYVNGVLAQVNLGGKPVAVTSHAETIQTTQLNAVSYLVPSILGMALMQTGIFAAIPLVADRQKLILKRLAATPLKRWQLIGSNVILRLVIALVQFVLIVGVGVFVFDVKIVGSLVAIAGLAVLGSLAFTSVGYVIASLAKTEDAANGMTSAVQFPLMFLSGTFFPITVMPDFLQSVARFLPLTYLSDALRQVMVGGSAYAPLAVCVAILAGWTVVCFGFAARRFQWQ